MLQSGLLPSGAIKTSRPESEMSIVKGKNSAYIWGEPPLSLFLYEGVDNRCVPIVYNSHGETRCWRVEIKQYEIQGVIRGNNRTITKQYMLVCHINNIENKWNKNSEGMITVHWKLRNATSRKAGSELRLWDNQSVLTPLLHVERTRWQQNF